MNPYIKLPKVRVETGRQGCVLRRCADKKVLHLGCVDSGLYRERFASGALMHQKLAEVSADLWGMDIDAEGIEFLQANGIPNLIVGDACSANHMAQLHGHQFDVIVACEIIEHLMNPGLFLEEVKQLMIPGHTELFVSLPCAFRLSTLMHLLRNVEYVHPDHNYWFSHVTASNLLGKAGLTVEESLVYTMSGLVLEDTKRASRWRRAIRFATLLPKRLLIAAFGWMSPFYRDGLIFVCTTK